MSQGQCLCGKCTVLFTGEPKFKALCHCTDCRKVSGSMFSTNLFVASHALTLESGEPKSFSKKADSGHAIVSFFCSDCGTTLWRETEGIPDTKILKEGILSSPSSYKPNVELYADRRVAWLSEVPEAEQQDSNSLRRT